MFKETERCSRRRRRPFTHYLRVLNRGLGAGDVLAAGLRPCELEVLPVDVRIVEQHAPARYRGRGNCGRPHKDRWSTVTTGTARQDAASEAGLQKVEDGLLPRLVGLPHWAVRARARREDLHTHRTVRPPHHHTERLSPQSPPPCSEHPGASTKPRVLADLVANGGGGVLSLELVQHPLQLEDTVEPAGEVRHLLDQRHDLPDRAEDLRRHLLQLLLPEKDRRACQTAIFSVSQTTDHLAPLICDGAMRHGLQAAVTPLSASMSASVPPAISP